MPKHVAPILFLIFNRADTTKLVFEQIRKQKPGKLFIASDGPREGKSAEIAAVQEIREFVLANIDWGCEVKTLFRDNNLGCGRAIHSAINWFFEQVSHGIILEDDCLPDPQFFSFCTELLEYYADYQDIFEITGTNLQGKNIRGDGSYYFSSYGGIWGWATWARAWKKYDFDMSGLSEFIDQNKMGEIFPEADQQKFWNFTLPSAKKLDTWDYQWLYTIWKNNGLCIVPNANLITNIGFNSQGTHTQKTPDWYLDLTANSVPLPALKHPSDVKISRQADKFQFDNSIRINKSTRLKRLVKRIFSK
ncbi:nucleotide-diphospho-sugar transferase [Dyadobacter sp. CY326]|uniref:nucleotide-diphospho-sugar transferase n=1 Tax=Dyadobacter sp. CY326 TaxID=2907300 RepID=UPI001F4016EB|nr:nucleotide-diphospho-sugar transferase [Dyadobacter sp. CY326]MCE7065381.1 nucleotide-diphospho-sugar transferase [Dyadobacter sp. CY326]